MRLAVRPPLRPLIRRLLVPVLLTMAWEGRSQAAYFSVTDLGTLGGASGTALGVNASGQVVGYSNTTGGAVHAFASAANGGALTDLGTLGGSTSIGNAVNALGQVVGYSDTSNNQGTHAFLSSVNGGGLKDLGTLGGSISYGYGLNAAGQVAGYSTTASGSSHAFLSAANGGALSDLGTLGGAASQAFGVNASGQVVGYSNTTGGANHAFLSAANGGALRDLGTLGGSISYGNAVNNLGQVAGSSYLVGSTGTMHAFLSANNGGSLTDLGSLGGDSSANGVDDLGRVVGRSFTASGSARAFFYNGTAMLDLNTMVDPSLGFTLTSAQTISGNYITAAGTNRAGQSRAFLVNIAPNSVPEPSSVVLVALGLAGAIARRRRSPRT